MDKQKRQMHTSYHVMLFIFIFSCIYMKYWINLYMVAHTIDCLLQFCNGVFYTRLCVFLMLLAWKCTSSTLDTFP